MAGPGAGRVGLRNSLIGQEGSIIIILYPQGILLLIIILGVFTVFDPTSGKKLGLFLAIIWVIRGSTSILPQNFKGVM